MTCVNVVFFFVLFFSESRHIFMIILLCHIYDICKLFMNKYVNPNFRCYVNIIKHFLYVQKWPGTYILYKHTIFCSYLTDFQKFRGIL